MELYRYIAILWRRKWVIAVSCILPNLHIRNRSEAATCARQVGLREKSE
jgi:hypothetical protein